MRVISVVDEHGVTVCDACGVLDPPLSRLRAVARFRWPQRGRGLLVRGASGVSTWFMRKPVDVVFIDTDFRVERIVHHLRPGESIGADGAYALLELPSGSADDAQLVCGERLGWGVPEEAGTPAHVR